MKTKRCKNCKEFRTIDSYRGKRWVCNVCNRADGITYLNTEHGYFTELYNGLWNRLRKKERSGRFSEERLMMHRPRVTKEEFFQLWEDHKKEHGMKCLMTGVEMTHIRGKGGTKNKTPTNISVDRLDNTKGYTKQNIIFVTNEFNLRKNAILIIDCINILRQYKLRFPETNTCKIIELYESIGSLQSKEKYKDEIKDFTNEKLN